MWSSDRQLSEKRGGGTVSLAGGRGGGGGTLLWYWPGVVMGREGTPGPGWGTLPPL